MCYGSILGKEGITAAVLPRLVILATLGVSSWSPLLCETSVIPFPDAVSNHCSLKEISKTFFFSPRQWVKITDCKPISSSHRVIFNPIGDRSCLKGEPSALCCGAGGWCQRGCQRWQRSAAGPQPHKGPP